LMLFRKIGGFRHMIHTRRQSLRWAQGENGHYGRMKIEVF